MIRAEWKKLLHQRWLIIITIFLILIDLFLFLNTQYTKNRSELLAVTYFKNYKDEMNMMTGDQAQTYLNELTTLSNFQYVQLVLNGEADEELLQVLMDEDPQIIEKYKQAGYDEDPQALLTRIQVISELLEQYQSRNEYPSYLESIQEQYSQMKDSSFYDGRPYAEAQGRKTATDFAKLNGTTLEIDMNWGIEALMEEQITSIIIVLLALGICIVLVAQDRTYDLFGLLRSCKHGRKCLIVTKLITALMAVTLICVLIYGSQIIIVWNLYGLGNINRPMQSVTILNGSARQLTVGSYLLDYYLRHLLAILVLTATTLFLLLAIYSIFSALSIIAIFTVLFFIGYFGVSEIASNSWIHFLNPVAWLYNSQLYANYWNINLLGKPVNALTANSYLQILLLVACTAYVILLDKKFPTGKRHSLGILKKFISKIKEKLWYPSSILLQEWKKQLFKNGILWMLIAVVVILLFCTRTTPLSLGQTEQIYHEYAKKYEGLADENLIESLKQEQIQFAELRERQNNLKEKWMLKEISNEQYEAISTLIDRLLENEVGLSYAIDQANTLVSWENEHGKQLFFTDDSIGRYLFENKKTDQYRGALLLLTAIVLTCGIFPDERKNDMQKMLLCTKGHHRLFIAKYMLGILITCIVSMLFTVMHLLSASKIYEFTLWNIPLQSIRQAQISDLQISVGSYFLLVSFMQTLGSICAIIAFLSLSVCIKNRFYAVLVGSILFVLPTAIYNTDMPHIISLWFSKVFLFATQMLEQNLAIQIGYLILLIAIAAFFATFSWKAYEKKDIRLLIKKRMLL